MYEFKFMYVRQDLMSSYTLLLLIIICVLSIPTYLPTAASSSCIYLATVLPGRSRSSRPLLYPTYQKKEAECCDEKETFDSSLVYHGPRYHQHTGR